MSKVKLEEEVVVFNLNKMVESPSAYSKIYILPRLHKCDKCDLYFPNEDTVTKHKCRLQEVRPFACEQCDKSYRLESQLKEHVQKIHGKSTTERVCTFCNLCFVTKGEL